MIEHNLDIGLQKNESKIMLEHSFPRGDINILAYTSLPQSVLQGPYPLDHRMLIPIHEAHHRLRFAVLQAFKE